jgi:hypothetical protein
LDRVSAAIGCNHSARAKTDANDDPSLPDTVELETE